MTLNATTDQLAKHLETELPYNPQRVGLYTYEELLEGYETHGYHGTRDYRIYRHFDDARPRPAVAESLAQRLHDHAIDEALYEFVDHHDGDKIVGIMGGHSTGRGDADFRRVVVLCRMLSRAKFIVATGGGPGVMEAGNLGAYLAAFDDDRIVDAALARLAVDGATHFPKMDAEFDENVKRYMTAAYDTRNYLNSAECRREFGFDEGKQQESVAIPTWFYGHEPTNLFCDNVAKYFSNGLREDVLLAVSRAGVVFAPGSAGTMQEVFMDLAQNHYGTFVKRSPMVFMGDQPFQEKSYHLVRDFALAKDTAEQPTYRDLIAKFTTPGEVFQFIRNNEPR